MKQMEHGIQAPLACGLLPLLPCVSFYVCNVGLVLLKRVPHIVQDSDSMSAGSAAGPQALSEFNPRKRPGSGRAASPPGHVAIVHSRLHGQYHQSRRPWKERPTGGRCVCGDRGLH